MGEQQYERFNFLPKDDYHWFLSDEAWVAGSDFNIRAYDLNQLKQGVDYSIDDWVTFIKSPTRLIDILCLTRQVSAHINLCEDGPFQWGDLSDTIGSDIWPDPTKYELEVSERVHINDRLWIDSGAEDDENLDNFCNAIYDDIYEEVQLHSSDVVPRYEKAIDYKLFDNDDEWISGSAGIIRPHYLETLRRALGVDDWVRFLKRADRLQNVLQSGDPSTSSKLSILEGGTYQWHDLLSPIWGLGSKMWPDPTNEELGLLTKVRGLCNAYSQITDKLNHYQALKNGVDESIKNLRQSARYRIN